MHELFSIAHAKYREILTAATTTGLTDHYEKELFKTVDLFTKVIELYGPRGEPYSLRAGLYMVYGQLNEDRSYLKKAKKDYLKALEVGAADQCNNEIWRDNISQIEQIERTGLFNT